MKATETIEKAQKIIDVFQTAPEAKELARLIIDLTQKVTDLQYAVDALKNKPAPPGTY